MIEEYHYFRGYFFTMDLSTIYKAVGDTLIQLEDRRFIKLLIELFKEKTLVDDTSTITGE